MAEQNITGLELLAFTLHLHIVKRTVKNGIVKFSNTYYYYYSV